MGTGAVVHYTRSVFADTTRLLWHSWASESQRDGKPIHPSSAFPGVFAVAGGAPGVGDRALLRSGRAGAGGPLSPELSARPRGRWPGLSRSGLSASRVCPHAGRADGAVPVPFSPRVPRAGAAGPHPGSRGGRSGGAGPERLGGAAGASGAAAGAVPGRVRTPVPPGRTRVPRRARSGQRGAAGV